jgi:hypothetical protein
LANSTITDLKTGLTSSAQATDRINDDGTTGQYGWYYDIPDSANGNASKVLINPTLMPGNIVMFYTQNIGMLPTLAAEGEGGYCPVTIMSQDITTLNFFDYYSGSFPSAEIVVSLGDTTKTFSSGNANRFNISGVKNYIANGNRELTGAEKASTVTVNPEIKRGRRAGWHIGK